MKTSEPPIIIEESYNISKETVWKAITEPQQMRQWYFEQMSDFKAEVGFKTSFMVQNEGRDFPHDWTVTDVIPEKKITYNWKIPNYLGDSFVTFELNELNNTTTLTLTNTVVEDFPDDIPEFKRESGVAGWNYFLKERLKAYLEKF